MSKVNRKSWTDADLIDAVSKSNSIAGVIKSLNLIPAGGNYKSINNRIKELDLDTSHFRGKGWNIGLKFKPNPPKPLKDILVKNSNYQGKLSKRLIKEGLKEHKCENCNRTEWENNPIPLELHHINGISNDNRVENLKLLCPNCHALTDNYRGRNIKSALNENSDVDSP